MKKHLREVRELLNWVGKTSSPKYQINKINTADCEILKLSNKSFLATTIDSISDEITVGLYKDPYTIGWMTAVASLSDLAAVAAKPLGLLLSSSWHPHATLEYKKKFAAGFKKVIALSRTHWLGGDNGSSDAPVFSSVGLGTIDGKVITRMGLKPGHVLALITKKNILGIGPALGFKILLNSSFAELNEDLYRPLPPVQEILKIKKYITAMIDTSDGIMTSLSILSQINNVKFQLKIDKNMFHPAARAFCNKHNLPATSLAFGEHGDYQILCAIQPKNILLVKKHIKDLKIIGLVKDSKAQNQIYNRNNELKNIDLDLSQRFDMRDLSQIKRAFDFTLEQCREANLD